LPAAASRGTIRLVSTGILRTILPLAAAALVAVASPAIARADDEDPDGDVRVERPCTVRSSVRLRVSTRDDDRLRVEVDIRTVRRGARWVVVLIHERRLVARVPVRTGLGSGALSLRRTVADWPGRDTVVVRALGPRGEICRAAVVVREQVSD
jgi:hypothetical protein